MINKSYPNINRPAALTTVAGASLRFVAIAARLLATTRFGGRINGALNQRSTGLRLNSRGLRHNFLGQSIRQDGSWQRRDLHNSPRDIAATIGQLSPEQNEKSFKHLVATSVLDKCWQNNPLGQFSPCRTIP